jgi:hypothetical protein
MQRAQHDRACCVFQTGAEQAASLIVSLAERFHVRRKTNQFLLSSASSA